MEEAESKDGVRERWKALAIEQKIAVVIFFVCGIVMMGLATQRINASIINPFFVSKTKFEDARRVVDDKDGARRLEQEARRRDTDGDGISDYDEENSLGTSPYLRDTDGDGVADNVELALGQNPNCVSGKPCSAPKVDVSALATPTPFLGGKIEDSGNQLYAAFQRGVNDQKLILQQKSGATSSELGVGLVRDPIEIRKLIRESGKIDPQVIDKLTDEQLLKVYDQALVEVSQKNLQATTGITNPQPIPYEEP
jgi:hypothetical protein